ncbi:MAG: Hsp20 family protein [Candidatus Nitrosotenuis sp.]
MKKEKSHMNSMTVRGTLPAAFNNIVVPRMIGFDDLFNTMDQLLKTNQPLESYPPFNVVRESEDLWRIEIAVAGFEPNALDVVVDDGYLIVTGARADEMPEGKDKYVHRGISSRKFERRFRIPETAEVQAAVLNNGLLIIVVQNIIPEKEVKRIEIQRQ